MRLGLTVLPEYIQSEGTGPLLDRLQRDLGVVHVTTSPYVMRPAAPGEAGSREPPGDAGAGQARLLDRPLWGQRALDVVTAPSFVPDPALYADSPYRPATPDALTRAEGPVVGEFIRAAIARAISVDLQIMAAAPPAYRVQFAETRPEDQPLMADGTPYPARVDSNATLGATGLRRYMAGLIVDLARSYPQARGLRFDWPEYPPYALETVFGDFNPGVAPVAAVLGIDLEAARAFVQAELAGLRATTPEAAAARAARIAAGDEALPGPARDLMRLRAHLVLDYARFLVQTVHAASGGRWRVFFQGFPPPLSRASGFDAAAMAGLGADVGIKFYTMHWPMMLRSHAATLARMTGWPELAARRVIAQIWQIGPDDPDDPRAVTYPAPDAPHPAPDAVLRAKMAEVRAAMGDREGALWGLAHTYGPTDDVLRRIAALADAGQRQIHLNRYAYVDDAKCRAIGAAVAAM